MARTACAAYFCSAVLVLVAVLPAASQTPSWRPAYEPAPKDWGPKYERAVRALNEGRYGDAEKLYGALRTELADSKVDDRRIVVTLNDLGIVFYRQWRDAEAETTFKKAIDLWERCARRRAERAAGRHSSGTSLRIIVSRSNGL